MILHSFKSIIRTPKKTILFLFLITLLALFLSIGTGMYRSAQNMLNEADDTFSTVVELNYLGDKGNDEEAFYDEMNKDMKNYDFSKLSNHPDVLSVNMENKALAYLEEKQIHHNLSELNNYVVIEVFNLRRFNDMFYQATISKVHFGTTMRESTYVMINDIDISGDIEGYDLIEGHKYLIIGRKSNGKTPTAVITPGLPEGVDGYEYVIDLDSSPDYFNLEDGYRFLELIEAFYVVNKSLPVTFVSSLEASEPYFSRDMIINDGRAFSEKEYQEGNNKVIILSNTLAEYYEVGIGDKLNLNLHYSKNVSGLSDYFKDFIYSKTEDYEVVGIFENKYDNRYMIYMPMADWIEQDYYSYTLARYLVKNGSGKKFIEDSDKQLLINMDYTLYDQGYDEAIKPIVELKDTAILLLVLGFVSGITILLLFSYLYVYKQRETLINMVSLGTGRRRVLTYVLFGSMLMVALASFIGSFVSSGFINNLTSMVFNNMIELYGSDMRYSERAIGTQVEYAAKVSVNNWVPAFIIILMLILSFILLFSLSNFIINDKKYRMIKKRKPARKKSKKVSKAKQVIVNKEQNVMFGSMRPIPLKFALVSIVRNSGRSLIVPLLTLILSIFLVFLSFLSNIQQEKRSTVYDRIPVNAYMTTYKNETRDIAGLNLQYDIYKLIDPDYTHRMVWNQNLYEERMNDGEYTSFKALEERNNILNNSDFFKEMNLYTAINYEYMGISVTRDGHKDEELTSFPNVREHKDAFGYDWFIEAINKMPRLAYADDLRYTPDFFGDTSAEVEFLSGYSYDSLKQTENIGMISRNLANEHGINMGDNIRITAWIAYEKYAMCSVLDLKVVGIYEPSWRTDVIYLPWIMSYDHKYYLDSGYPEVFNENTEDSTDKLWNEYLPRNVRAATFTLKNTENLDYFREYLDTLGYSETGKINAIRKAIVIQDKSLEETIKTLDNYISLMDVLIPIMIIIFGIIGFMVSYLSIRHRLNELAIMRSMGARKTHVFLAFFIEQLILFVIGLLPVIIFGIVVPGSFIYYAGPLGYYTLSYLAGTAVALMVLSRAKLLDILFSKE